MNSGHPARPGETAPSIISICKFGAVLFLIALNLRPSLSSLATLLNEIQLSLGLSSAAAGALTMLPSLCFGLAGGLTAILARRVGMERAVALALCCLIAGLLLRSLPSTATMFFGTILTGFGIGVAGILLPAILKRDFSGHLGLAIGLYTMAMCGGGALGAALTVPLRQALNTDWTVAIGLWAIPAVLAAIVWVPYASRARQTAPQPASAPRDNLRHDSLAWSVTGFMSFQAALAFIVLGWLPAILQSRGLDALSAGYVTSASVISQTITALCVPIIAARMRGQQSLVALALSITSIGFAGIALAPDAYVPAFGVVLGLGQGANFGLALAFIGLRTSNASSAARLSGMSQGIGYTLAALGPLAAGFIRQSSTAPIAQVVLFVGIAVLALICGWRASADRVIGGTEQKAPISAPATYAK